MGAGSYNIPPYHTMHWKTVSTTAFQEHLAAFASTHSVTYARNYRIFLTKFYQRAVYCKWIPQAPVPLHGTQQGRKGNKHSEASKTDGGLLQAIDDFGDHLLAQGRSEETVKNHGYLLGQWANYLIVQHKRWTEVELRDLAHFLRQYRKSRMSTRENERYTNQRSPTTVALMTTCLRSFYRWAAREGFVNVSPAIYLDPPKRDRRQPRRLQAHVLQELLQKLNNPPVDLDDDDREEWHRNRVIILTLLFTDVRLAECAGMTWEDVDLDENWLRVWRKGNKEAYVPIHNYLRYELLAWRRGATSGPVFPSRRGGGLALTDEGISEMFRRFVKTRLNIACTARQLRHTCATALDEQDANLEILRKLLGHESVRTTQTYLDLSDKRLHDLIHKLPQQWEHIPSNGQTQNGSSGRIPLADPTTITESHQEAVKPAMLWRVFLALVSMQNKQQ